MHTPRGTGFAVISGLAGFGLGMSLGRPGEPPGDSPADVRQSTIDAAPRPDPPAEPRRQGCEGLEEELRGVRAELALALRLVVASVAAECPNVEVVDLDCREPPCAVLLRTGGDGADVLSQLVGCPAWRNAYPEGYQGFSFSVPCGEFGVEEAQLITPSFRAMFVAMDEVERNTLFDRLKQRSSDARASWSCPVAE